MLPMIVTCRVRSRSTARVRFAHIAGKPDQFPQIAYAK